MGGSLLVGLRGLIICRIEMLRRREEIDLLLSYFVRLASVYRTGLFVGASNARGHNMFPRTDHAFP